MLGRLVVADPTKHKNLEQALQEASKTPIHDPAKFNLVEQVSIKVLMLQSLQPNRHVLNQRWSVFSVSTSTQIGCSNIQPQGISEDLCSRLWTEIQSNTLHGVSWGSGGCGSLEPSTRPGKEYIYWIWTDKFGHWIHFSVKFLSYLTESFIPSSSVALPVTASINYNHISV